MELLYGYYLLWLLPTEFAVLKIINSAHLKHVNNYPFPHIQTY